MSHGRESIAKRRVGDEPDLKKASSFPGTPLVKPADLGDAASIPDPGGSRVPQDN